jgi:ferredoxin
LFENVDNKSESLYVFGDKSILTELEQHNIQLNHSCRQGHCGSCNLRLITGEVKHKGHLLSLSPGEILACLATPVSDIKITTWSY